MGGLRLEAKLLERHTGGTTESVFPFCVSATSATLGLQNWDRGVTGGTAADGGAGGRGAGFGGSRWLCEVSTVAGGAEVPVTPDGGTEALAAPSVLTLPFSLSHFSKRASQARSSLRKW